MVTKQPITFDNLWDCYQFVDRTHNKAAIVIRRDTLPAQQEYFPLKLINHAILMVFLHRLIIIDLFWLINFYYQTYLLCLWGLLWVTSKLPDQLIQHIQYVQEDKHLHIICGYIRRKIHFNERRHIFPSHVSCTNKKVC